MPRGQFTSKDGVVPDRKFGMQYTEAEREQFKWDAWKLSSRGWTNVDIAKELGMSHTTVGRYIKKAKEEYAKEHAEAKPQAVFRMEGIIQECWRRLENLADNSREAAALLREAREAQHVINNIIGSYAPVKSDVKGTVNHRHDLSILTDEELETFYKLVNKSGLQENPSNPFQ